MIGFDDFLSALIIAALILVVMSVPKLVIFFVWTLYKLFSYEFASRLLKSKNLKNLLPKRVYGTLLKVSEDSAEKLKSQLNVINDYKKFVTEPLTEAISSLILTMIISRFVSLAPEVQQILLWLGIILMVIIILSFGLLWYLMKLADRLLALTSETPETENTLIFKQ